MNSEMENVGEFIEDLKPSFPENKEEKAIEFVKKSHPGRLVLDHGQHCTCCGTKDEELISNPDIPRVLCMECYTWATMKLARGEE